MVFTAVHWWEIGHIWLVEPDKPCLMKYNHAWSWFWEILERYENHRGIKLTVPNANNDIKWFLKGRSTQSAPNNLYTWNKWQIFVVLRNLTKLKSQELHYLNVLECSISFVTGQSMFGTKVTLIPTCGFWHLMLVSALNSSGISTMKFVPKLFTRLLLASKFVTEFQVTNIS